MRVISVTSISARPSPKAVCQPRIALISPSNGATKRDDSDDGASWPRAERIAHRGIRQSNNFLITETCTPVAQDGNEKGIGLHSNPTLWQEMTNIECRMTKEARSSKSGN